VTRGHELLEHTADIGIRARGSTPEEAFAAAAEGLAELMGAWLPGEGHERKIEVEAADRPALLVAWVDELLFLRESEDAVFGGFDVDGVSEKRLRARVLVSARGDRDLEDAGIKAGTYHRLRVEPEGDAWLAQIYLDV
jgi:SHS2 domain-containing protein